MTIISLLTLVLLTSGQAPDSPTDPSSPQMTGRESGPQGARLLELIDDLASPAYRKREAATSALMDCSPSAYPILKEAFDRDTRFETRRRIKQIVTEIYLSESVGPARAFLGISQGRGSFFRREELRIPAGASALMIQEVFTGCAADAAGIRRGDLIFIIEDHVGRSDLPVTQFTELIGSRKPGDSLRIGLLRGGEGLILQDVQTPGFRIRELADIGKRLVRREDDPRVLPGAAAFLVEDAGPANSDTPIQRGDLIVALDEEPISPTQPDAQFRQWIETHSTPGIAQQIPVVPVQPVRPLRKRGLGTIQIIRGGKWIEVTARLGRWPTYLNEWLIKSRNIEPSTASAVQGAFEDWWRVQFDPTGEFADRADNDPLWRFDPRNPR